MNYQSVADLATDTRRMAWDNISDVDLVVGIPRSGLLAANLVCPHRNAPVTDVDGLFEGRRMDSGERCVEGRSFADLGSVFVVDDSVRSERPPGRGTGSTGTASCSTSRAARCTSRRGGRVRRPPGRGRVDAAGVRVERDPPPRVERRLRGHRRVLCCDPTPAENDDEERYREFLSTVAPGAVPDQRIGHLVTSRLEEYRLETEAWLDEDGVWCDEPVMMDLPSEAARQRRGNRAEYKADVYDATDAPFSS